MSDERRLIPLTPLQWSLLRALWRAGGGTVTDVRRELDDSDGWRDYKTVASILYQLADKGYIRIERQGRSNYHSTRVDRSVLVGVEIRRFLEEALENDPQDLVLLLEMTGEALARARGEQELGPEGSEAGA